MPRLLLLLLLPVVAAVPAFAAPFAYITNDDATVSVIDVPAGAVVATIDVGAASCTHPRGVAVSPSGLQVYVSCIGGTSQLAVIDTVTNAVVTTVPVPADPFGSADGLAMNPVLPRLYVANFVEVSVFDTASNTFLASVAITHGGQPEQVEGVAVNPTGTRVYVTQVFSSMVNVIDTATNTEIATIAAAGSRAIVVDPAGARVYTGGSAGGGSDISVIDAATNTIVDDIPIDPGCDGITGLAIDPTGATLYVGCRAAVAVVDVATHGVTMVPVGFNVFGVDVTADGSRVVAVSNSDNSVSIVDTATNTAGMPIAVGQYPYSYPGHFVGPVFTCGNHVREPGESCDGTACCTASCQADVGASCDDANGCTTDDRCTPGATCVGSPVDCGDGDDCTQDTCSPATGLCTHVPTPKALGGDDTGCVPPDKFVGRCEDGVEKAAAALATGVVKCHLKASAAGLKAVTFDEEACESNARGKYDLKVGNLRSCPDCLDAAAVGTALQTQLDGADAAALYCDSTSGTPLADADDGGFVPANKAVAKCESGADKAVAKLVVGVIKCHVRLADAKVKGVSFDEEGCESAAVAKFDVARGKLKACPSCLATALPGLGAATATGLDQQNAQTYCASASGAFVDGV
jgi:YVTN family beta-propeller protein